MILGNRFIARSSDKTRWLEARATGVTATMVAEAASGPAGLRKALEAREQGVEVNAFMEWGTLMEPALASFVHETTTRDGENCVLPNDWLLASETNPRFLATPDGLSLNHERIGEYKTSGKDYDFPPLRHIRQMQWQMFVSGAQSCAYAWMLRVENEGSFVPGWLEPRLVWVDRDEEIIKKLVSVATDLLKAIDDSHS